MVLADRAPAGLIAKRGHEVGERLWQLERLSDSQVCRLVTGKPERLSDSQVWRFVTGKPERLNLHTLIVLCDILECRARRAP